MIKMIFFLLLMMKLTVASPMPLSWDFPKDYAPHPSFNTEWWYFTGHLIDEENTLHGFQFTVFRHGLDTHMKASSPWSSQNLYTAHFAFTNGHENTFFHESRSGRDYFNQIDADVNLLQLRVKDWTLKHEKGQFFIHVVTEKGVFDLMVKPTKPMIFHGDKGISYKNASQKNYSHYYSHTRLKGNGKFVGRNNIYHFKDVSAWMDREIFDSLLSKEQFGWDWFAIQLESNEELMLFRVKSKTGDYLSGSHIDENGRVTPIKGDDIELKAVKFWKSKYYNYSYPIEWRVSLKNLEKSFFLKAVLPNQELSVKMPFAISYWEGQSLVSGDAKGRAYIEIVPYLGSN